MPPLFSDGREPEDGPEMDKIGDGPCTGPALRKIREKAGVELNEISKELKLRMELLKSLEEEKFEALPEAIYLKVHLKNYASFLGLDPGRVTEEYLRRYRAWKEKTIPAEK
jgi:cytoskeletal protein RodZ